MAGPCLIRPTSLADLPAIEALEIRAFSDPWTTEQLGAALVAPGGFGSVAVSDGRVVGHLIGRVVVDQGEILSLATDPSRRREGIAAALLDGTLAMMAERQVGSVWLEVRASNEAAQALYRSRGFSPRGRRRGYYQQPVEDAIILGCDLPGAAFESPGTP